MTQTNDLHYTCDGLFTTFLPNTTAGEAAWRELHKQNEGSHKVLSNHAPAVIQQLRAAGYAVGKAPRVKSSSVLDDELLEQLSD